MGEPNPNFFKSDPRLWFSGFTRALGLRLSLKLSPRNMITYSVLEGDKELAAVTLKRNVSLSKVNSSIYCEHLFREVKEIYPVRTAEFVKNNPLN